VVAPIDARVVGLRKSWRQPAEGSRPPRPSGKENPEPGKLGRAEGHSQGGLECRGRAVPEADEAATRVACAAFRVDSAGAQASARQHPRRLEKSRPVIPSLPVMVELPKGNVGYRGSYAKGIISIQATAVEPGVPASLHGLPPGAPYDRLGLARWLVDRQNPFNRTRRSQSALVADLRRGAGRE